MTWIRAWLSWWVVWFADTAERSPTRTAFVACLPIVAAVLAARGMPLW